MSNGVGAKSIPDITFTYWAIVDLMFKYPAMYGLDNSRRDFHEKLCRRYGIDHSMSKSVTDNMDKYETAVDFHFALLELKEPKNDQRQTKQVGGRK